MSDTPDRKKNSAEYANELTEKAKIIPDATDIDTSLEGMDLTVSELVQTKFLKVGGGFALGLLAANFMSKKTHKNVGKAALVGTVAAGIPLGFKVLNNNRKLVAGENWTEENVVDQTGKIAIVTGSNSGIGFETACVLAKNGAKVIMAVRALEKGETAANEIKQNFRKPILR